MITTESAGMFAREWLAAWNARSLPSIMQHYADTIEFTSPFIVSVTGDPSGIIRDKAVLESYFDKALQKYPDLRFELQDVLSGMGSVVIYYRSVNGLHAAEVMELDEQDKIIRVQAHYGDGDKVRRPGME